jgi:MFS transporter, PPP family, 3-phenylpropionic acid transporter
VSALHRFVVLYALMYAAFGASSPFLPAFFQEQGLKPEQLGILFGLGTAIRLVSGPLCGRLADRTQALRALLAWCAALAAVVAFGLLSAHGFSALVIISVVHAAALAPITTLADALALGAAVSRDGNTRFQYGWVRGSGSAMFIIGTMVSGQVVGAWGLGSIIGLHGALLIAAAGAAMLTPRPGCQEVLVIATAARPSGIAELLRMPRFRRVMLVSALVLGSHAMHDTFAVMRWSAADITPTMASALWSESVAAEVVVFFIIGPSLVQRLGSAGAIALAAGAGVLRWVVMAWTANVMALVLVQPLHGLTFATLHLACMHVIAVIVPQRLAATAQALYALGAGGTTALLALASGGLYASFGAQGFFVMAALCALVPPMTFRLRSVSPPTDNLSKSS